MSCSVSYYMLYPEYMSEKHTQSLIDGHLKRPTLGQTSRRGRFSAKLLKQENIDWDWKVKSVSGVDVHICACIHRYTNAITSWFLAMLSGHGRISSQ